MSKFNKCQICKEWHWDNEKCQPEYFVYHEEYMGDDPKSVRAVTHEDAACKYAQYYNQDDYPLMNGDTIDVKVEKDGEIKWFSVGAEPEIHYSSTEIEPPKPE